METINTLQKYVGMTVRLLKRRLGMTFSNTLYVYIWVFIYPLFFFFKYIFLEKKNGKVGHYYKIIVLFKI